MNDLTIHNQPIIDTKDFELGLSDTKKKEFQGNKEAFKRLIKQVITELKLNGYIEHLKICSPPQNRAVLYRDCENPWPSKTLCLDIYSDKNKYMCTRLLRHEFGHEADRQSPGMLYDPSIEKRWRKCRWVFEMAANISLDARLGDLGLGKEKRLKEFQIEIGTKHINFFEEQWTNPPQTWPAIEDLANKIYKLKTKRDP